MPGLRYGCGTGDMTRPLASVNRGDGSMGGASRPHVGGISRDWEMARAHSVLPPLVSRFEPKARRAPQWLEPSREDSKGKSFFSSRPSKQRPASPPCPILDPNTECEDLQAMVQEFIENQAGEYADCGDGDGASPGLTLIENLQMLSKPHTPRGRELLADVQRLLPTVTENADLICDGNGACCDANGTDCEGSCVKRLLVKYLKAASYSASVCTSKWLSEGRVPGGEYEYIDVVVDAGDQPPDHHRLIVDINFQAQFEIARPSPHYHTAFNTLPPVFVGTVSKLEQLLLLMSDATKLSLEHSNMHLPPWRTFDYFRVKWLSDFERFRPIPPFAPRPPSLLWREKRAPRPSPTTPGGNAATTSASPSLRSSPPRSQTPGTLHPLAGEPLALASCSAPSPSTPPTSSGQREDQHRKVFPPFPRNFPFLTVIHFRRAFCRKTRRGDGVWRVGLD